MFDPEITTDIQSLLIGLSSVPLGNLIGSIRPGYRYGYIGKKDRMMYPLITPGAIVQIDEQRKHIARGPWHYESERPIYFLEMRTGFACCWCAVEDGHFATAPALPVTYAGSALERCCCEGTSCCRCYATERVR
jgi:hypothetical protein